MARTLCALIMLMMVACASPDRSKAAYVDLSTVSDAEIEPFQSVIEQFFSLAISGDVNGMLELTSAMTMFHAGPDLKNDYKNDKIPALKNCQSLLPGGKVRAVTVNESRTGPGYSFIRYCSNPTYKNIGIKFIVLRENDQIVVAYVGPG